jgi:hypothetical protein
MGAGKTQASCKLFHTSFVKGMGSGAGAALFRRSAYTRRFWRGGNGSWLMGLKMNHIVMETHGVQPEVKIFVKIAREGLWLVWRWKLFCIVLSNRSSLQLGRLGVAGPGNGSQGWLSKWIASVLGSLVGNSDYQCRRTSVSWRNVRSWRYQFQSIYSRTCICYPSLRIKGANHSLLALLVQRGHCLFSKHWLLSPDNRHHAQGGTQEVVHFLLQLRRIVLFSQYGRHLACFAFNTCRENFYHLYFFLLEHAVESMSRWARFCTRLPRETW